jgi:tetratricopeptide (TPR) repeat protein
MYVKVIRLPYGDRDEDPRTPDREMEALTALNPSEREDLLDLYTLLLILYRQTDQEIQEALLTNKLTDYYLSEAVAMSLSAYVTESEALVEKAVLLAPDDFEVHFTGGQVHLNGLDYTGAYRFFSKAIELNPAFREACLWRAEASLKSGLALLEGRKKDRAERALRAALDDFITARASVAQDVLERKQFEAHWLELHINLAKLAMEREEHLTAAAFYNSGLIGAGSEGAALCHYGLGRAYKEMGRPRIAVANFNLALEEFSALADAADDPRNRMDEFVRLHEIHMELAALMDILGDGEAANTHRAAARDYWRKSLSTP